MVYGIVVILFACALNTALVMLPAVAALIVSLIFLAMLRKVKMLSELFEQLVRTVGSTLSLFFAATLQVYIWNLSPKEDSWRWTLAGFSFVAGAAMGMLYVIFFSLSPSERAWSARRFMISTVLMLATLAVSFSNFEVYAFVKATPGRVATFVFGKSPSQ